MLSSEPEFVWIQHHPAEGSEWAAAACENTDHAIAWRHDAGRAVGDPVEPKSAIFNLLRLSRER